FECLAGFLFVDFADSKSDVDKHVVANSSLRNKVQTCSSRDTAELHLGQAPCAFFHADDLAGDGQTHKAFLHHEQGIQEASPQSVTGKHSRWLGQQSCAPKKRPGSKARSTRARTEKIAIRQCQKRCFPTWTK